MKNNFWKRTKYEAILSIFLILILFFLSGCSNNEEEKMQEKAKEELKFVDTQIIEMFHKVNQVNMQGYVITEEKYQGMESKSASSQNNEGQSSTGGSSNSESAGGSSKGENTQGNTTGTDEQSKENDIKYGLKQESVLGKTEEPIDWESLKSDVELLYKTWTNVLVDLHSQEVNNDDILAFSTGLDQLMIKIKEENKTDTLVLLANLYSYISKYAEQIVVEDEKELNIYRTKLHILTSSVLVEQDKWEEIASQLAKAQEYFSNVLNESMQDEKVQSKMSRTYVLLNELNSTIALKDKDVFYVKYKSLMENLQYFTKS